MLREAERTLYTLSANYQADLSHESYEVIAIDNASGHPLNADQVRQFGPNFHYDFFETASASPASAINYGARLAKGKNIAVIVDGARMVSPRLVRTTLLALKAFPRPFVCALGWHLGHNVQNQSLIEGYDQAKEDRLLDSVCWRDDGYLLFEISTLAQSSRMGFLGGMPTECSWFAMSTGAFLDMGGYDERFQSPGGGLVNHDFLHRVLDRPGTSPVVLLGEGSFHQFHGGVATNVPMAEHPFLKFEQEYKRIHGRPYDREHKVLHSCVPEYLGQMPQAAMKFVIRQPE